MATILQPPLSTGANSFPPSPTISSSYPDLVSLQSDLPYSQKVESKQNFVHTNYDRSFAPSIPSTAPSSPLYIQSMGSTNSYFSTPSYSTLDPNEDFDYDDDDSPFPSFEISTPQSLSEQRQHLHNLEDSTAASQATATPPSEITLTQGESKDDNDIVYEPSRHVDYLSHDWKEQDIWSSWRYVVSRRSAISNSVRLENASWRTWVKAKNNLKTVSPESLNWMKDCDVTWLYGPLQVDTKNSMIREPSPPPSQISTSSSFLHKKPILKKKSASAVILERSQIQHSLLARASEIIRVQQSSPRPGRGGLRRGGSDFSLPSYQTSSTLNTPAEYSSGTDTLPRSSFGSDTPCDCKHVFFNEEVRQVQAIDSEDDEKDRQPEEDLSESDEDDDGGLIMAPPHLRSNRSTPRGSFSDQNKTIAPLPPTTLKYRKDTPEPPEIAKTANLWSPPRSLNHSSSQETLTPSRPSQNFLLDDDPELEDAPWPAQTNVDKYSPYTQDEHDEQHPQMRRTASGMFMPYDENEEEAVTNNTLFGQAMYAVNTFRDIAHVVWNVGWNRGR